MQSEPNDTADRRADRMKQAAVVNVIALRNAAQALIALGDTERPWWATVDSMEEPCCFGCHAEAWEPLECEHEADCPAIALEAALGGGTDAH